MVRNKTLLPGALILFVLINTSYYWEGMLGGWNMLLFPVCVLTLLVLFVSLLVQFYRIIRNRFKNRSVVWTTGIAALLLSLIVWQPYGIINFESLEDKDVLIAFNEGVANCTTTLKLKENKTFYIRSVCFGIDKEGGTYTLNNDTIKLNFSSYRPKYKFAVFKKRDKEKVLFYDLYLYQSAGDTLPYPLAIKKNLLLNNSAKFSAK
ncbi:hypothetical protein SNE26_03885 [Mucilaginibacter sp. cycad4]|uniref:hypothetical protein n=1 Tax=Mucilaginibacter sp. cycad4 TaxID=3342096 RepID=UPI002AAAB544|nr:hypothetical protein [Mucilaginibacter gossypii]WPV00905.1 hypothetical protein SNE26_03885 [Mucilaginibacter gossypii]